MMEKREYTAEELRDIISGKRKAERVPNLTQIWINPDIYGEDEARARKILSSYPCDATIIPINTPNPVLAPPDAPDYVWVKNPAKTDSSAFDAMIYIDDFGRIDDVLKEFPSPDYPNLFGKPGFLEDAKGKNAYRLGHFWYMFFERHWSLRGMENALTDFYDYPESVHKLYGALADFYCGVIERAKKEQNVDGMFISDDLGTQAGPMFSEEIFVEFFKPYYKKVFDLCHSLGIQFWLHSCGNIERFIPHFVEIGLDVLHPIQKYTMDERKIAQQFGNKICIWAGFDVQRILPFGRPDEVRAEVRRIKDIYKDARWMFTLGNGATPDCSLENIETLLAELFR